ncbi:hypothetical protein NTE_02262 [Candidatus Nitrososphaera evergladensis SR1]|uniref:Uncharacterized protein n=2 Tax=Nitrososphaera TaxID=497726 RepID=A0A075MS23_9ARCH|nr:hypothetical protein NTE_02262 [Candidatus Nitrososphaera evergladensis SR1]
MRDLLYMAEAKDRIEFKMLEHESVGDDTVSFKLEDGTIVKVKVSLERVGIATNYRNPDGTPHYAVNSAVKVYIIPADKRFTMPKNQVSGAAAPQERPSPSHIT